MATATKISGVEGNFAATGFHAHIERWDADSTQDLHDVSGFASGGFEESIGGLLRLRGSCAGYLESDGSSAMDPKLAFNGANEKVGIPCTLTIRGGNTITGTALFSRKRVSTGVNQAALFFAEFRFTGAYSTPWAS